MSTPRNATIRKDAAFYIVLKAAMIRNRLAGTPAGSVV